MPDDFPVHFPDGTIRWTTQRQIDYERDHPPRHAPGYLLSEEEWPDFRCSFQCPDSGFGLGVLWNYDRDYLAHVVYDTSTYGAVDDDTQAWAKSLEGQRFATAAHLVDALVEAGCYLDDLL